MRAWEVRGTHLGCVSERSEAPRPPDFVPTTPILATGPTTHCVHTVRTRRPYSLGIARDIPHAPHPLRHPTRPSTPLAAHR